REVDLLRLAKKQKKVAVGMFKSWDNPTSKANVRFFPDYIICLTNYIAQEAHLLYGYPLNRCFVSGVPQYDMYSNPGILWERETFCNKLGLDPHKKIILYAPSGDWMTPDDIDILREVLQWVNTGKFGDTQVLLRLHPAYYSSTEKLSGRPNLIVHRPGHHSTDVLRNFIFDKDDIQLLANTLHHSQVLINSGSTLNIEAAIFDKPSINVCYDVRRNLPFRDSVVRFYQREHLVNIINTGALNMVHSHTELFNAIVQAFKNPAEKSLERRQLSLSQGYDPEGKAAENIAEFIYKLGSK
ncbi:MAG TPA: CDP-glycerol glycerophosphotransferase family protein, partial [Patescibacteria group bacterium]|nr:CDP-glycerol glycerophosphotransferase family protein [Patescibacteria group bacterium]